MDEKKPDPVTTGGPQDGAELDDVDKFTGRRLLADPEGGAARAASFLVAAGVFASLEEAAGAVAESMRKATNRRSACTAAARPARSASGPPARRAPGAAAPSPARRPGRPHRRPARARTDEGRYEP
jgi:hypothetical protein